MKKFFYLFTWNKCFYVLTFSLLISQIVLAQTWVRKVDGFSMWSIGKDYAGNIYAGTTGTNRGIFKSTDGGETWTNVFSTGASNYLYISCDSSNNIYVANVSNGLIYSTDGGQNFTTIPASTFGGANVNSVACGKNGHIFVGVTNGGVWRSTDFGATFTQSSLNNITIVEIKVDKFNSDIIYAGGSSSSLNGFFISNDDGITFGASTNSLNIWEILQTAGNDLYIATTSSPYPFDKSTDGGLTWTTMSNLAAAKRGATLDLIEDIYISGNGGVFKSTDGGTTFINHNFTFSSNKILTYDYKIMVCAIGSTNGGVWIYTDSLLIPVELTNFTAVADNGNVLLKWTTATELNNSGFEIERSINDEGFEKIAFVAGFGTTTEPKTYSYIDESVYGLIKYRLKQNDFDGSFEYSNVVEVNSELPLTFKLLQNYPNPFNPSTKLSWQSPVSSWQTLKVYDILGNNIATLVDEYKPAGRYEVEFNASSLSGYASGVYFYRLETSGFMGMKKMILLK
jgi:hypothetical protein